MAIACFSWVNRIDAAVAITASNGVDGLPIANVQNSVIARFFRATAATQILADFGSDVSLRALAFAQPYRNTMLGSSDTVRWRLDADGGSPGTGAAYDSGAIAPGVDARYGYHFHLLDAELSVRYLALDVSTACDIGRLWAGPVWQPSINLSWRWSRQWQTSDQSAPPPSSLIQYVTEGERARLVQLPFEFMADLDAETADDFSADIGIHQQFLACIDPDAWARRTIFGRLQAPPPTVQAFFDVNTVPYAIVESR